MGIKIFLFNLGYRGFWFALIRNPKSGPRFTKVWRQIISKGVRYFLVWSSTNLNSIWNWMILLSWVNFYPNLKKLLRGLYESASNTRVWFAFWWYFASWTCCLHPNMRPVVYYDQLLGAARTLKLVETFFVPKIWNNVRYEWVLMNYHDTLQIELL